MEYGDICIQNDIKVHGGLTFSQSSYKGYPTQGDGWWIGFDCGHFHDGNDESVSYGEDFRLHGEVRSLEYVVHQCEMLINQINKIEDESKLQECLKEELI